jgi:hypothetical protein
MTDHKVKENDHKQVQRLLSLRALFTIHKLWIASPLTQISYSVEIIKEMSNIRQPVKLSSCCSIAKRCTGVSKTHSRMGKMSLKKFIILEYI